MGGCSGGGGRGSISLHVGLLSSAVVPAAMSSLPHPSCGIPTSPQEERRQLQAQMGALQARVEQQGAELADFAGNDPDRYNRLSERGGARPLWPDWIFYTLAWGAEDQVAALPFLGPVTRALAYALPAALTTRGLQRRRPPWRATRPTGGSTTSTRCGWEHKGGQAASAETLLLSGPFQLCMSRNAVPAVRETGRQVCPVVPHGPPPPPPQGWLKKRFEGSGAAIDSLFKEVRDTRSGRPGARTGASGLGAAAALVALGRLQAPPLAPFIASPPLPPLPLPLAAEQHKGGGALLGAGAAALSRHPACIAHALRM